MGCDIHLYTEYRRKNTVDADWMDFGKEFRLGRDYLLFGIMAKGVRCDPSFSFDQRGLPDDLAYNVRDGAYLYISEKPSEREVTLEQARKWEARGHKIINNPNGEPTWVSDPDWHSHSWLTTEEFVRCLQFYSEVSKIHSYNIECEALLASLKKFEEHGFEARIVFWFDN